MVWPLVRIATMATIMVEPTTTITTIQTDIGTTIKQKSKKLQSEMVYTAAAVVPQLVIHMKEPSLSSASTLAILISGFKTIIYTNVL